MSRSFSLWRTRTRLTNQVRCTTLSNQVPRTKSIDLYNPDKDLTCVAATSLVAPDVDVKSFSSGDTMKVRDTMKIRINRVLNSCRHPGRVWSNRQRERDCGGGGWTSWRRRKVLLRLREVKVVECLGCTPWRKAGECLNRLPWLPSHAHSHQRGEEVDDDLVWWAPLYCLTESVFSSHVHQILF